MVFGRVLQPMEPASWDTRQVMAYAALHQVAGITEVREVNRPLREKWELLVRTDLNEFYATNDFSQHPVGRDDLLDTSSSELLVRRTHSDCAAVFRENPEKLQAVVEAGLARLNKDTLHECYLAGKLPALEWWLVMTLDDEARRGLENQGAPRVCGRALTKHEAIAHCLECAVDSMCVFCADCFQNSPCRNHKHTVRYGGGGGLCDCGDPMAWNSASFCSKHRGFQKNDDPTASLPPVQKRWLEVVARGLSLYQVTIMQFFTLYVKDSNESKDRDLTMRWFDRTLRRTVALSLYLANAGEGSRRLMCLSLMGETLLKRPIVFNVDGEEKEVYVRYSCAEEIFLQNMTLVDLKGFIIWENSLLYLLDGCISDPLLRVPVAELLLKYGERLSVMQHRHVKDLSVQVLSVKEVVDDLLQKTPNPQWECVIGRETILHRLLSTLLYVCCYVHKDRELLPELTQVAFCACHWFENVLSASENVKVMVVSRQLFRAWCKALCLIGTSSKICRETRTSSSENDNVDKDYAMMMEAELRHSFNLVAHMVLIVGNALLSGSEPIPVSQQKLLQSLPPVWDKVPDVSIGYPYHRQVLDTLNLQHASSLFFSENNMDMEGGPCRVYMREMLMECLEFINAALAEKRNAFKPVNYVLSGQDAEHMLPRYDLLDEKSPNPTSFVIPHMRFFAMLVKVWTRLLRQQNFIKKDSPVEDDVCTNSGDHSRGVETFYSLVSEVFASTQAKTDYWIDECLMPSVLLGQIERGLWRRDECDVTLRSLYYLNNTTPEMDYDIYLLYVLMLITPSEAFATQLLQRHAVTKANEPRGSWYPLFLRLILTLCLTEWAAVIHDEHDLRRVLQREAVHGMVVSNDFSFHIMEIIAGRFKYLIPGLDPSTLLPSILGEVAVTEQRHRTQVFALKDAATWRSNVNLYHPLVRDQALQDLQDLYERLVRREQMAREREATGATTKATTSSSSSASRVVFPLPKLPWLEEQPGKTQGNNTMGSENMVHHKVCLLLQTPAVLSVAIAAVHMYLSFVMGKKEKTSNVSMSERSLLHAISVLYISMQACHVISSSASSFSSSFTQGPMRGVDWDMVKTFQQQFMPPSGYTWEGLKQLLLVEGIMDATTLKEKLEIPLVPNTKRDFLLRKTSKGVTTISALHQIYTQYRESEKDMYGIAAMTGYILHSVEALSSLPHANEEEAEQKTRSEINEQRRLRLKERQAMLLRRVKANDAKSAATIVASLDDNVKMDGDSVRDVRGIAVSSKSVMATLLLRLAEVECCMCRDPSNEPLMLFASTFTSDTLYRLRFDESEREAPMAYKVNGQIHLCGHAAHRKCVAKMIGRIGLILERVFRASIPSIFGPKDFNCPICVMVCTTLCPLPTLAFSAGERLSSVSSSSSASLFEDVRSDTLKVAEDVSELHQEIARATVGAPSARLSGEDALVKPSELQLNDPEVWVLAETIRTIRNQMCVTLEWVKAGGEVRYNELLTLLSVLVSIDVSLLASHAAKLKKEFYRKGDELCLLLVNLLHCPERAAASFALYTRLLILSSDHGIIIQSASEKEEEGGGNMDAYNKLLVAMWRELGCLTLLKVLILDTSPSEVVRCEDDRVTLLPLNSEALITLEGRQRAVLTMLCYLLEVPFQVEPGRDVGTALSSLVHSVTAVNGREEPTAWLSGTPPAELMQCKPLLVPYDGPMSWRKFIVCRVFHLSNTFGDLLLKMSSSEPCSVCGDNEAQRVWCALCGHSLCLRPSLTPPELYDHARTCGNGLGIYLHPATNVFLVLLTVQGRHLQYRGLYADEYGQTIVRDFRGRDVPLDDEAIKTWLSLWIQSQWGVQSTVVKKLALGNLRNL
ncbi:putative ubiquitin ligase [Trypanosoma cruzi]|uniref:E3 ubiquitin-protein ligase n=2 Tax=Trypanosoma cruzi TaxID=5693 RepID=Q4DFS7_TRYCC|nr:ubiquitin ligase, putative [Trypanosoma cruzi]EAN91381.1 ubiquitin ligase, putative [Trypanosoma cruzi]PWV13014.1 putative ubiquitin ligase [Trypanosoma cruzi]|eukprot:XP_813232.1 ubiquitin ligase [Trypanosoma cruzi strain CL Brener]